MRIQLERTYLTTTAGRHVVVLQPQYYVVEADSLRTALLEFVSRENGRVLGSITESETKALCTAWASSRAYLLVAEPAPD